MSISEIEEVLPRHQEIANGTKSEFNVAFDLMDNRFVSVYVGSEKLNSGYNVDIENRKIIFDSAPANGELVTIVRVVPVTWESKLHGALNSEGINSILTHIIASVQTVKEEVSRAIKSNIYDPYDGGQASKFFLEQLIDAQDILNRSENTLRLVNLANQTALNNIESARLGALSDIQGSVDAAAESEVNAEAHAVAAKLSEDNAKASEVKAKQIADSIVNDSANADLSNLTSAGQAKFDAKQNKLTAGTGLEIVGNIINNTQTSAEWGNIGGDIGSQFDLITMFLNKLDKKGGEITGDLDVYGSFETLGSIYSRGTTLTVEKSNGDSWVLNTGQGGVYQLGFTFTGGGGYYSQYNFKYDLITSDTETIISNTNRGNSYGCNIKLTSSTSEKYGEISLNADQAKAPNPETKSIENIATTLWVNNKHQLANNGLPSNPDSNVYYYIPE